MDDDHRVGRFGIYLYDESTTGGPPGEQLKKGIKMTNFTTPE